MRAKLVMESVNFERGKDPKSAMDIGLSGKDNVLQIKSGWNLGEQTIEETLSDPWGAMEKALNPGFYDFSGAGWTLEYLMGVDSEYKKSTEDHGWDLANYRGKLYVLNPRRRELKESVDFHRAKSDSDIRRTLREPVIGELFVQAEDEELASKRAFVYEIYIYLGPAENPYNNKSKGLFWRFARTGIYGSRALSYSNFEEPDHHLREYYIHRMKPINDEDRTLIKGNMGKEYRRAIERLQNYLKKDIEPFL